jgi:hypothetical protein
VGSYEVGGYEENSFTEDNFHAFSRVCMLVFAQAVDKPTHAGEEPDGWLAASQALMIIQQS